MLCRVGDAAFRAMHDVMRCIKHRGPWLAGNLGSWARCGCCGRRREGVLSGSGGELAKNAGFGELRCCGRWVGGLSAK